MSFGDGEWVGGLDEALPAALRVGGGSALYVSGWLFHRRSPLRLLALRHRGVAHPVRIHSMPRRDVHDRHAQPGDRPRTAAYRSGFWAVLPVPGVAEPVDSALSLGAETRSGDRFEVLLAEIRLLPAAAPRAAAPEPGLVAVCMATHEPDLALFRRQVDSIRRQTHETWRCVVVDDCSRPDTFAALEEVLARDPRFELHRNAERLGFYFNFERALELAPPEAEAVALCDQDDEWYPAKLATLLAALRDGDRTLVYSDQRLVRPDGGLVAPTFWGRRENQWTDLPTLVAANTVTGAASLFRRDLLDVALPLPPRLGGAYHDHWLAAVALACGTIDYVDEPLYDYVQHGAQALGHAAAKGRPSRARRPLRRWQNAYFSHVVPSQLAATALLERCGRRLRANDRAALAAVAARDAGGRLRLVPALQRATDGEELRAPSGIAWRSWSRLRTRLVPTASPRHSVYPPPSYAGYRPDEKGSSSDGGSRRRRTT